MCFITASASPFEGLAERMNWLKVAPEKVREVDYIRVYYDFCRIYLVSIVLRFTCV